MGGKEYGKSGHLDIYFHSLKVQIFSGLHFYTISKTLLACTCIRPCSSDFKVETLLNNAFKFGNAVTQWYIDEKYIIGFRNLLKKKS